MPEPWERREKESIRAFEAFLLYLRSDSLHDAYCVKHGLPLGSKRASGRWCQWCCDNEWVKRKEAYREHIARIEEAEREKAKATAAKREVELWAERRRLVAEREWAHAQELSKKALQMLDFPLAITTVKTRPDGTQETTIEPVKWSARDAAAYLALASKLARLAAQMPTDNQNIVATDPEGQQAAIAIIKMDLEEL